MRGLQALYWSEQAVVRSALFDGDPLNRVHSIPSDTNPKAAVPQTHRQTNYRPVEFV